MSIPVLSITCFNNVLVFLPGLLRAFILLEKEFFRHNLTLSGSNQMSSIISLLGFDERRYIACLTYIMDVVVGVKQFITFI